MNLPPTLSSAIRLQPPSRASSSDAMISTPILCKPGLDIRSSDDVVVEKDDATTVTTPKQQKQIRQSFTTPVKQKHQAPTKSSSARFDSTFATIPSCTTDGLPNHLVRVSSTDKAESNRKSNRTRKSPPKTKRILRTKSAPIRSGSKDDCKTTSKKSRSKNGNKKLNSSLSSLPLIAPTTEEGEKETVSQTFDAQQPAFTPLQSFMSQLTADKETYCAGNKVDVIISLDNAKLSPQADGNSNGRSILHRPTRTKSAPLRSKDGKIILRKRGGENSHIDTPRKTQDKDDSISIHSILDTLPCVPSILKNSKNTSPRSTKNRSPPSESISNLGLAPRTAASIRRGVERSRSAPIKPRRHCSNDQINSDRFHNSSSSSQMFSSSSSNVQASHTNVTTSATRSMDRPPSIPNYDANRPRDGTRKNASMKVHRSKLSLFDDNASVETLRRDNTTRHSFDDNASVETIQHDNTSGRKHISRRFQANESTVSNRTVQSSQRQKPKQVLHVVPADKPPGLPVRRTHSAPLRKVNRGGMNKNGTKCDVGGDDKKVLQDYIDRFILQSPKKEADDGVSRWNSSDSKLATFATMPYVSDNTKSSAGNAKINDSGGTSMGASINKDYFKVRSKPKKNLSRWNTVG